LILQTSLQSCRNEFNLKPSSSATSSKFVIPKQDSFPIVQLGDSAHGFLYSQNYITYCVVNKGINFQIDVTDYATINLASTTSGSKYVNVDAYQLEGKYSYGAELTRTKNSYLIKSTSDTTYIKVNSFEYDENNTGYFSLFFSERALDRIVINDQTSFYPDYNSNTYTYTKKLQLNGVAGKKYHITLSSDYNSIYSSFLTANKGTALQATSGSA
jgi:hypothetical protein